MLFRRRIQPSGSALLRPDGFALHSSAVFFGTYLKAPHASSKRQHPSLQKRKPTVMTTESPEQIIKAFVEKRLPIYQAAARDIHAHPETSNHEYFACKRLSELLKSEGFEVQVDVAGHPTGFDARFKSGKPGPILCFLAEYDALVGLGHGGGHNLFGATSALAGAALAQAAKLVGGEIRVYGTPGEEGGENGSAKGSFVREGFFKDVDAALCVHPSSSGHRLTNPSLGCAPVDIEFHGKASHAASAPEQGINALDALIQVYNGINALRQHLPADVRIHGIITHGGDAPNIVPEYAAAKFYLRAATAPVLEEVWKKVERIVEGAALMTGAKGSMKPSQNRVENTILTPKFDAVYRRRMEELLAETGSIEKVEDSAEKAGGSSDVGNVSQVIPTIQPTIRISKVPVRGHSEEFKAASCSALGLASIGLGAKALALTGLDLLTDPQLLADIKADHADALVRQASAAKQH